MVSITPPETFGMRGLGEARAKVAVDDSSVVLSINLQRKMVANVNKSYLRVLVGLHTLVSNTVFQNRVIHTTTSNDLPHGVS